MNSTLTNRMPGLKFINSALIRENHQNIIFSSTCILDLVLVWFFGDHSVDYFYFGISYSKLPIWNRLTLCKTMQLSGPFEVRFAFELIDENDALRNSVLAN